MEEKESGLDILKHQLVPKHEVLSAAEKKDVIERMGSSEKQMPKVLDSDPVIKRIGAKPGDMVRITRKSQTAGESVYYRVVVEK